jgi:PKD repeat protein
VDPVDPVAATVAAGSVLSYPPCVQVTLSADVTGRPPLTSTWTVAGGPVLTGNPLVLDTGLLSDGNHEIVLEVDNSAGSVQYPVDLVVESLGFGGGPGITPAGGDRVWFQANTLGATEWRWTWGDGTGTSWLSGCDGSAPTHTYPGAGSYPVLLEARSCREGPITWSGTVEVTEETPPVIESFEVVCPAAPFCSFRAGEEATFSAQVSGSADLYMYDWDGDGVSDELTGAPVASHAYDAAGYYTPRLTVVGAGSSDTAVLEAPVEVVAAPELLFSDGFESGDLRKWSLP